jgi:putative toxin-antitoxin system antitoxin component (TIGR02293 family)
MHYKHLIMGYQNVGKALNLKQPTVTLQDLMQITRQGIVRNAVDSIAKLLGLSTADLARYLHVSERTLQRYSFDKELSPELSDRLIQIAKVYAKALEVFEDESTAVDWLKYPNRALGDTVPMDYLDNSSGVEIILDELTRIEYGVFA